MAKSVPRWFGFNPPFIGGKQNVLSRQEEIRLIKNDVIQLLLSMPKERVHRSDFGTLIRGSLFDPADVTLIDRLTDNIQAAMAREEPRLKDVLVTISLLKDNNTMKINVFGHLTNDPNTVFTLDINKPLGTTIAGTQDTTR